MGNNNSTTTSDWAQTYTKIKSKHDAAYVAIEEAITLEERSLQTEALEKYKQGVQLIDEALTVQVTCPEHPDFTWEKACLMIQKMKKTRGEVLSRLHSITSTQTPELAEQPPSYEEAMSTSSESPPQTYTELASALNQLRVESSEEMEAEVIYMFDSVKLYFISPDGSVSSPLRPQTLKIILVENEGVNGPRAILQVGDWIYPLIPGVSPCYRTDYGAFILPNVYADTPGSSIGIILPPETDSDVYDILESILYGIVGKGEPPSKAPAPPEEMSEKISSGIISGASFLAQGLVTGASKVSGLINKSTPKLINRMESTEQPKEIPHRVTRGMQIAEDVTSKTAKVTGYVAEQVGIATMKLGRFLAPHIQKQGTRLLTTGLRMSERDAEEKVKGVMTVAAGAVEGFSTVYHGLESSAGILGQSLKDNTVKVVQHKYGQPAGEFAGDTLNTVGNVYHISRHARIIRPSHLAKSTAKAAGKAVVYQYKVNDGAGPSSSSRCDFEPPTSGSSDGKTVEKK